LPQNTKQNGSLSAYVILHKKNTAERFSFQRDTIIKALKLSKYKQNDTEKYVNLLSSVAGSESAEVKNKNAPHKDKPVTHLLRKLVVYVMHSNTRFISNEIPHEIYGDLRVNDKREYLPIVHIDNLIMKDDNYDVSRSFYLHLSAIIYLKKKFQILEKDQSVYNLTVALSPISVGGLRFYKQIEASIDSMKELGFSDSQLNEITSLFTDTNVYLVLLTFAVSMFHVSVKKHLI
jgi:hypothetical protein